MALFLAYYGLHLIATADNPATYVLRDGLSVALAGVFLFVLNLPATPLAPITDQPNKRADLWLLLLVISLAIGLRLGWLTQETLDCLESECERAMQLTTLLTSAGSQEEQAAGVTLESSPAAAAEGLIFGGLTRFFYNQSADALWSLRLSGALLGALTVPLLFAAARSVTTAPAALVGALLLTFSPWHIWASRTSNPWIVLPLVICLVLWAILSALQAPRRAGWLIPALLLFSYETLSLPWGFGVTIGSLGDRLLELITQLWHGASQDVALAFSRQPLLHSFTAALALLGWAMQIRGLRQRSSVVLLAAGLLATLVILRSDWSRTPLPSLALVLLPCALIAATLAADQMIAAFQQIWQPVIRPALVAPLAAVALAALLGPGTVRFIGNLGATYRSGDNDGVAEMSRLLAQRVKEAGGTTTFFAPAAVLASPVTRLLAGPALQNAQVQSLEGIFNTLLNGAPNGNLLFLIPPAQQRLLALLTRFYPVHSQEPQTAPDKAEPLFTLLTVDAAAAAQQQGLSSALFTDSGAQSALATSATLQFEWQEQATLDTPFTAQWQGTIRIPISGAYGFGADGIDPAAAFFNLQLDGMPVLESTAGQLEQSLTLAKGFYRLEMSYRTVNAPRTSPPAPLVVRWLPPNASWQPIPTTMLHPSPLLNMGLLASYYGNDQWQEPLIDQRKDLLIGPPADLTPPYSVRWQGKVATVRAGEYLFGAVANGVSQVMINGQIVINGQPSANGPVAGGYHEGTIYLPRGWHDLEVRYAPGVGEPDFQLLWQPAGGAPGPLDSSYLAPMLVVGSPVALSQPPPPLLVDPTLGDDQFSLAQASDLWQPQVRLPPQNLALLPFAPRGQLKNGCGSGDNQLSQPHGVAINPAQDRLYVADTANKRVLILTLDGQPTGLVQDPQFQEPVDVAFHSDGRLLILDALAQQIFAYDPNAQQVLVWPLSASFYRPRGLAIDMMGNVSVADTGGGRVAALDSNGLPLGDFGGRDSLLGKGQPVDTLAVPNGLWAISAEDGRLWRLNGAGSMTAVQRTDTINGPHLAGLPDGAFFVSDPARALIAYHAANGEPRGHFINRDFFTWPTGIAAAQQGAQVVLAVVDTPSCTLSVWQMPSTGLTQLP